MATVNPTANASPDAGLGGSAVTTPSNTGHASTSCSAAGDDVGVVETKSCGWSGFSNPGGGRLAVTLQLTHTSNGTVSGATALNAFQVEYSVNNGSSWTVAVSRGNMSSAAGPTVFSAALSTSQDLSLVKVRDSIEASAVASGDAATASATVADIQIVLVLDNGQVMVMM